MREGNSNPYYKAGKGRIFFPLRRRRKFGKEKRKKKRVL